MKSIDWNRFINPRNFTRALKYQYLKLLRSPEGSRKVAMGFAIGFAVEFMVISTMMIIYLLFYPLVRLAKGSVPTAVIGHLIAKLTFLPIPLLGVGKWIGSVILPSHFKFPNWVPGWLSSFLGLQLQTILGMSIISLILGVITYFIIYFLYEANRTRRSLKISKKSLVQARNII